MTQRHRSIACLVLVAAAAIGLGVQWMPSGEPTPAPQPAEGLVLRGQFIGPTAAEDAATLAAYAEEVAAELEHDGMSAEPFFRNAVQFDELRTRARILLCRGVSIGDRQPKVLEILDKYLTEKLGTSGGPVSPEQRSAWVAAYREIGRSAADVSR